MILEGSTRKYDPDEVRHKSRRKGGTEAEPQLPSIAERTLAAARGIDFSSAKKQEELDAERKAEEAEQGKTGVDWGKKSVDALNEAVKEEQEQKDKSKAEKGE